MCLAMGRHPSVELVGVWDPSSSMLMTCLLFHFVKRSRLWTTYVVLYLPMPYIV